MNNRVYYNRYNNDKTKFTDIVVMSQKKLEKLKTLPWITICKVVPVDETNRQCFSVYPQDTFSTTNIKDIKPLSIVGWN